jgi:hypothetical protein
MQQHSRRKDALALGLAAPAAHVTATHISAYCVCTHGYPHTEVRLALTLITARTSSLPYRSASTLADSSCRSRLPLLPGRISAAWATGTSLLEADTCTRCLHAAHTRRHKCISKYVFKRIQFCVPGCDWDGQDPVGYPSHSQHCGTCRHSLRSITCSGLLGWMQNHSPTHTTRTHLSLRPCLAHSQSQLAPMCRRDHSTGHISSATMLSRQLECLTSTSSASSRACLLLMASLHRLPVWPCCRQQQDMCTHIMIVEVKSRDIDCSVRRG